VAKKLNLQFILFYLRCM